MDDIKSDAAQAAHDDVIAAKEEVVIAKEKVLESMTKETEVTKDDLKTEIREVEKEKEINEN